MTGTPAAPDPRHPPIPPVSGRDEPRFGSAERKAALAGAFAAQGADYDRLRPGYPETVLEAMLAPFAAPPRRAIDLGAGTGKLSRSLVERGLEVTAVDTSAAMLEVARGGGEVADGTGTLATRVAPAEATGLPAASAELVTVAQAWHWFDAQAASAEAVRLLAPGGVLALVWNMLDVTIPWVHRLSRIMHAGDIHREDFAPTVGPGLELAARSVHQWQDPMPTQDVIDLARTRSYVITAPEDRRQKVLANLDWYLHDHLGHARGAVVGVPYRTDLFLYRAVAGARTDGE
ncbi:class I SAM-dependent methyltransferase [Brachybacterium saurashtrense]|uniref:Class I SAM-dependent methyltransferase n=1 Tax=Brachybacterium saurashtrense TaxID=556288 RepID=A0A345YQE4_9MICO|nr:class I SAM-dependent methyltransferase [Brachybacterium saurashtrense]AXK46146.1 class I SAM-dependent methyltransferase [Brachybacterium saurashtrense]RRR23886.1 class I SAM-dependent methyltransferase [Brachybacterium saurashtrense]